MRHRTSTATAPRARPRGRAPDPAALYLAAADPAQRDAAPARASVSARALPMTGVHLYLRLLQYVRPYWWAFGLAVLGTGPDRFAETLGRIITREVAASRQLEEIAFLKPNATAFYTDLTLERS